MAEMVIFLSNKLVKDLGFSDTSPLENPDSFYLI